MTLLAALPSRKDEAWRYADHAAVARAWPQLAAPETIRVGAGEQAVRVIDTLPEQGIARLSVDLAEGATLSLFALVAGRDYGRLEVAVTLAPRAHFHLGGAIIGGGGQVLEIVSSVDHAAPDATSSQVVRSVLGGRATGSFLGRVHVARGAIGTDAAQSVKAMLLDRGATANAVPQLEIYADDVKCAHGATVGELDATALFYLAARGLPPADARRLMLQAFIADAFVAAGEAREALQTRATAMVEALL